jgi:hypothetical protein
MESRGMQVGIRIDSNGRSVPLKTLRQRGDSTDWHSNKLSGVTHRVAEELRRLSTNQPELAELASPFDRASRRARTKSRRPDQSLSSWTPHARRCYTTAVATLLTVSELGTGPLSCPLTSLWALYEDWIGAVLVDAITGILGIPGVPVLGPLNCSWHSQWVPDGMRVSLLAQPTVTATPVDFSGTLPHPIHSVTSNLRPDYIVSVDRPGSEPNLFVIDAKQRTTRTAMDPEDVAEAGSKYLWGIRRGDDLPVEQVLIASSSEPQTMHSASSRIGVSEVRPAVTAALESYLLARLHQ